jgi:hypothetical protein
LESRRFSVFPKTGLPVAPSGAKTGGPISQKPSYEDWTNPFFVLPTKQGFVGLYKVKMVPCDFVQDFHFPFIRRKAAID